MLPQPTPDLPDTTQPCTNCKSEHYVVINTGEAQLFQILRSKNPQLGRNSQAIHVVEVLESNTQHLQCQLEIEKKLHEDTRNRANVKVESKKMEMTKLINVIDALKRDRVEILRVLESQVEPMKKAEEEMGSRDERRL